MKTFAFIAILYFFSVANFSGAESICPPKGTITASREAIASENSIDVSEFTGPINLSNDINFKLYHKIVGEEIHLVLESQDTTNRWLGFGFAEQQSGHMKGK